MVIFAWIIFGGLVGWIASIIMGVKRRGLIRNIIIGLLGSVVGGFLASLVGMGTYRTFTLEGFAIALAGAVLLIWIFRRV